MTVFELRGKDGQDMTHTEILEKTNKQTIMTVTMIKSDSDERIRKIYLPTSGHLSCFCPVVAM